MAAKPNDDSLKPAADTSTEQAHGPAGGGSNEARFPVVGIGASAGGLDAFQTFFATMPADSGMAFVLIPHLAPTRESQFAQLVAHVTGMPVTEAVDGMVVEANHVYVIPPNTYMTIRERALHLSGPVEPYGPATSIDLFLRSLADDQHERAIGIILSGTGAHGTLGLQAIKAEGGMVMVQDPATAAYDSMPRSAVNAGLADYVLPVEQMPAALLKYAQHFGVSDRPGPAAAPDDWKRILAVVFARTKHDFRGYRKAMVRRRIERRMGLNQIAGLADYLAFLRAHPDEVRRLAKDLLIGVTSFFRDPEAFDILDREVIAPLVERKEPGAPLRVWVPGCATGEEAYSIAILLLERLAKAQKVCPLQIFATDVDEDAIVAARQGIYPESIAADITAERLQRFFTQTADHHYQVNKSLRHTITFAVQDLIHDAPFSKLDLISCRNVLIYLEPDLQRKLIALFHFALAEGGTLLLGPSEGIGRQTDLFEALSRRWRVYQRLGPDRPERVEFPLRPRGRRKDKPRRPGTSAGAVPVRLADLVQHRLLADYAPAAVLINRADEILYFNGPTSRYLEQPSGRATRNLFVMAREGLRTKLRQAILRATHDHQPVAVTGIQVKHDGSYVPVKITVKPMSGRGAEELLLVVFEDEGEPAAPRLRESEYTGEETLVQQLEAELHATRSELQTTMEEMKTANEELRSANEEVGLHNEELQSANEELGSSREEMQALNEELNAVNNQLRDKVIELEAANNDMANLLNSTDVATMFLDMDLRIRWFSPATTRLFRLIAADVGRPLRDIVPRFRDDDLLKDAQGVLEELVAREKQIEAEGERWCIRRILPYCTRDERIEGVVFTFVDVTGLKKAEIALQKSNEELEQAQQESRRLAAIVESSDDAIIGKTLDGVIVSWNAAAERLYGYSAAEAIGRPASMLSPPHQVNEVPTLLDRLQRGEHVANFRSPRVRKDGQRIIVSVTLSPVKDRAGKLIGASAIARDITEQARMEERLRLQAQVTAHLAEGVVIVRQRDGVILYANERLERMFGYGSGELLGQPVAVLNAPGDKSPEEIADMIVQELREKGEWKAEIRNVRKDGSIFWSEASVSTFEHTEYGPVWITVQGDITERKRSEEALRESETRLRRVLDALPAAAYTCDAAGLITYFNPAAHDLWGQAPKLNHPDDRFCGTYRLYWADGTPLRREQSFMAQAVLEGTEHLGAEVIIERPDGSRRFVLAHASPLRNTAGQLVGGINVLVDITERQQMEQALRDSRARLAAIINTALDAIITIDANGIIDSVNPATEKLFGYTAAEMIGQNVAMLMPSPYKEEHDEYIARYLRTGEKHILGIRREVVGQCKNGRIIPMDLAVHEFHDRGRRMFIGIHHDLRPRKQLEQEVLEAATAEQRAIGQALHDSTGQELTALELLVQSLAETVAKQSPAVTGLTTKVLQGLQRVHTQIRGYARGLIPVEVDGQGLTTALAALALRTNQTNKVACTFECPEPVEVESLVVANHLFHIAQEAVANALRHAKPRRITIQLESDNQFITLRVRDDGVGFRQSVTNPGMGLKIMRYRAGLINARLTVQRAQPAGTLVTCTVRKGAGHGQEQSDPQ